MFGKKHAPKAPWSVQLLTTDFLVDGHLDGDDPTGPWFLHVQAQEMAMATLTLTEASFEPTAGQNVPETRAAQWVLPSTALFVGVMPRDEGSMAYCANRNSGSKHPIPGAVVFVGPYAIRGTVLSPDADLDILSGYPTFAMQNVVIDNLAPGARLKGLAAPYIIVRSLLLHGIVLNS
jgi:hypothetical protein